jgi:hypothetical protein
VSFCGPTDPLDEPEDPELPLLLPLLPLPLLPPLDEPEEASTTSRVSSSDRPHEELAAIAPAIARHERASLRTGMRLTENEQSALCLEAHFATIDSAVTGGQTFGLAGIDVDCGER